MDNGQALPNFFIVGAPKSGTTSLYHCLDQHPEIYMSPVKEPSFFASDIRFELLSQEARPLLRHDPRALRDYFDGPMQEKGVGGAGAGVGGISQTLQECPERDRNRRGKCLLSLV